MLTGLLKDGFRLFRHPHDAGFRSVMREDMSGVVFMWFASFSGLWVMMVLSAVLCRSERLQQRSELVSLFGEYYATAAHDFFQGLLGISLLTVGYAVVLGFLWWWLPYLYTCYSPGKGVAVSLVYVLSLCWVPIIWLVSAVFLFGYQLGSVFQTVLYLAGFALWWYALSTALHAIAGAGRALSWLATFGIAFFTIFPIVMAVFIVFGMSAANAYPMT